MKKAKETCRGSRHGCPKMNKGITLIALVITIIIMLLLVAVTVNYSIKSGLLTKSKQVKIETEKANLKDKLEGHASGYRVDYLSTEGKNKTIKEYLVEKFFNDGEGITDSEYKYTIDEVDFLIIKDLKGNFIAKAVIKEDGTIEINDSTEEKDIHIKTVEDLKWLAKMVNGGKTLKGYKVYLDNNLDLGAKPNVEGKWDTEENEKYKWTPIGNYAKSFEGEFLGQNNIISGLYINDDSTLCVGLFGSAYSIKDLTIKNSYIHAAMMVGAFSGAPGVDNCIFQNCHCSDSVVSGRAYVGGLIGMTMDCNKIKIINCSNSSKVDSTGNWVGGIAGDGYSIDTIERCSNEGEINGGNYVRWNCWIRF